MNYIFPYFKEMIFKKEVVLIPKTGILKGQASFPWIGKKIKNSFTTGKGKFEYLPCRRKSKIFPMVLSLSIPPPAVG